MFEKVKYVCLNDMIYDQLKTKIINNELKPGVKLDIDALSASLGVSRTPVNNALKALVKDGYVTVNPRSGSYIRKYSVDEMEAIFDFREALEQLAVRKSIGKADNGVLNEFEMRLCEIKNKIDSGVKNGKKLKLIDEYFETETGLHQYIISLCPQIIGDELQNLIDLTKRVRRLHLFCMIEKKGLSMLKTDEIKLHIDLIDAVRRCDAAAAEQWLQKDINSTKWEILEFYQEISARE